MQPDEFFASLWQDYVRIAPRAQEIHDLFTARGERVVNDHVAFRTYDLSPIAIEDLEPFLFDLGYRRLAPYEFPRRGLRAWSYVHPDPGQPRIFFSELISERLSAPARKFVGRLVEQVEPKRITGPEVFWSGRPWAPPRRKEYRALRQESEYAAWVAALGLRANHFTISVNHLEKTPELAQVLEVVKRAGHTLNSEGGEIKGSPQELLEQGSTLAERQPVEFAGGELYAIPTCYYEFARRWLMEDGSLYPGFVAASADRIFASTEEKSTGED